jgi:hypothetical protein
VKNETIRIKASAFRWVPPFAQGWFAIFGCAGRSPPTVFGARRGPHSKERSRTK